MAAEQLTDQEKLFRVRARRRLIGAVALVLLMLTILPMLLDDRSNQKMPAPDVAISIPSQDDGNFSSKIVPTAPAPVSPPVAAPVPPAAPVAPASANDTVTPIVKPEPMQNPVEPLPPPAAAKEVKPAVEAKSAQEKPVTEKPVVEKIEPVAKKPKVDPKPPSAKSVEKADPQTEKPAEAKKGSVSVQVGVITDGSKVKQVVSKISDLGLKANTENINTPSGVKVRIRCGPYPSKVEAEKALGTLKTAGFKPILVINK